MKNQEVQNGVPLSQEIKMRELEKLFEQGANAVIQEISPKDPQYNPNRHRNYFSAGQSALRCIKLAMLTAGKEDLKNILDLPCGYGRVLRTLKAAFPKARLTACDVDQDAVDFCARVLNATPVYSKPQPEQIEINDRLI